MIVQKKRLLIIGVIALTLIGVAIYIYMAQSASNQSNQEEATQDPNTNLTGSDSQGNPMPENQKNAIYYAGTRSAEAYFTYSPFESPTARKARLQNLFTKDSVILTTDLPPFAGQHEISATISGQIIIPVSKGQGQDEKNMRIDVEMVEKNINNEFISSEKSTWVVFLKGSNTTWNVFNILPINSPEIPPIERSSD